MSSSAVAFSSPTLLFSEVKFHTKIRGVPSQLKNLHLAREEGLVEVRGGAFCLIVRQVSDTEM